MAKKRKLPDNEKLTNLTSDDVVELMNRLGVDKSPEEQVPILKNVIADILNHGWIDDEVRDQIMYEIAKDNGIPYKKNT